MASGVLATGNSLRVALFTPTSVAWADRITAIKSSNVELYSSSVVGDGLAAAKRAKMSVRSCVFMKRQQPLGYNYMPERLRCSRRALARAMASAMVDFLAAEVASASLRAS